MEALRFKRAGVDADGHPYPMPLHYRLLEWCLKQARLYERGYRNFLDIRVNQVAHRTIYWPVHMSGFRILHLSDLHIDLDPRLLDVLCSRLSEVSCDMVIFTGDFCEGSRRAFRQVIEAMKVLFEHLPDHPYGKFGVLGNHDSLELGIALEKIGLRILANEAVEIETPRGAFSLAGVDDPFFFELDDLERANSECREGLPKLLLSHSPQIGVEAEACGFSNLFSGHTHGGQICLPGGYSPVNMKDIPPRIFKGLWRTGSLSGYTSSGTGACHIPVRYNCPPEITIHTLNNSGQM
jgi:predicted MPP superfamily phosphohydrolase